MGKTSKKRKYHNKNIDISESHSEPPTAASYEDTCNVKKSKKKIQNVESQDGTQKTCVRDNKNKKSKLLDGNKIAKEISNKIKEANYYDKPHHDNIEHSTGESNGSIKKVKQKKDIKIAPKEIHEETVTQVEITENNKSSKKKRKKYIDLENPVERKDFVKDTNKNHKNECKQSNAVEGTQKEIVQQDIDTEVKEKPKKKKKRKVVVEEIVNDEDIDRYCDELDEVHNKQYEDWVKLIEANLSANKKVKNY